MDEDDIPLDPTTLIRMGRISAVTLSPPRCRVHYGAQDEGEAETPPLRWITLRSGDTRYWSPPTVGEEAIVFCPDGQIGNGVVLTGLINDNFPAAGSTLAELVTYKDGAVIGYDPETHTLAATLPAGSSATIKADALTLDVPNVEITGTLAVGEDVIIAGKSFNGHRHNGVQRGTGQSDPPSS